MTGATPMTITPNQPDREREEGTFWLIVREPGMVPDLKGPWLMPRMAETIREFIKARPKAFIDLLTIDEQGPFVQHAPEVLQMADGRSMSVGRKHNARVREAATAALAFRDADRAGEGEDGRVRIAAWNAAKGEGCSDDLAYRVVEAVAREFAVLFTPATPLLDDETVNYRKISGSSIDDETVERCAVVAEGYVVTIGARPYSSIDNALRGAATAIRALKGQSK